jgi:hypothetical protein
MQDYKATYTRLLELMRDGYALGEHPIAGSYIEFPGVGFHRICLYEYGLYELEKAPPSTFSLVIFAGDTCKQSRELFKHFSYTKAMALEKSGWSVESSFHFSWQRKKIIFPKGYKKLALSDHIDYWKRALDKGYIRKYNDNEFDSLKEMMSDARIMDERDIEDFDKFFRTHKYKSVITCPGIFNRISYSKERLNEDIEMLAAELNEKKKSLIEIYDQSYAPTHKS